MRKQNTGEGTVGVLNKAIGRLLEQLEDGSLKGSMADLVRLLQLQNEMTDSEPRPVTVRWIDACQTTSANEE